MLTLSVRDQRWCQTKSVRAASCRATSSLMVRSTIRPYADLFRGSARPTGRARHGVPGRRRPVGHRADERKLAYVAETSAALVIEAASVSTYSFVSFRVISQPMPDSQPDTVIPRVSRLPSGCGSTTCEAVTVTPGEVDSQVLDAVGQLGDGPHRGRQSGLLKPRAGAESERSGVRRSTASTVGIRSGQRSTSTTTAQTRSGGAAMVTLCCRPATRRV